MLAEINMDSLLSIQDQYLNAVATLLKAGQQQQQQQQQQKQQMIGINKHKSLGINSRGRKQARLHQTQETKQSQTTCATLSLVSPLDLSTKRSAASSPNIADGVGVVDQISNLLKIIPQSTPQTVLNLAASEHQALQQAQSITSSTCPSASSPICCSFSRPSSTSSSSYQQKFQDQTSYSPASSGLMHAAYSSEQLISSSKGPQQRHQQQRLTTASSKKSSASKATKSHLCEHCGRSFSRSDMLTRHSRLHSGLKPYQCDKCHQVFSRSDHLSTHERTHTGEKPYQCKFCSYSACRRDMITRHMRTHTSTTASNNCSAEATTKSTSNNGASRVRQQLKASKRNPIKLISTQIDDRLRRQADDQSVSTSVVLSIAN